MKRSYAVLALLIVVIIITATLSDRFLYGSNIENVLRRTALFGIISLGAVFVIVVGGIDLSIGSMVCLTGVLLPFLVVLGGWPFWLAASVLLLVSILLGVMHGVFITRIGVQPFIVTLCGLLLYRGVARGITADQTQGFGSTLEGIRSLATGRVSLPFIDGFAIPAPLLIVVILSVFSAIFLHMTVWGRYMKAVGSNEQAARYSGIPTHKVTILAYALCALFSGLGGILFVLDVNSAQPADFGNFFELYAIAGAVLGGCSLKGGEATVFGALLGTAVMQVLRNSLTLLDVPTQLEYAMIGAVLLIGVSSGNIFTLIAKRSRKLTP